MKKIFSKKWRESKQPRKQRKYRVNSPLHIKRKFLSVNLSKELRKKQKRRNVPVRKGDVVKVMRGKFKKKQGKVTKIETKKGKIFVEGIQIKKKDGSMANVYLRPSNLQIIELNLEDKKRVKSLIEKTSVNMNKETKENI